MAAMQEDHVPEPQECANCGATQDLLKCSRCHNAYFCSVKCQKAYWPFHKTSCHRNEFADAVEEAEPKFARWMRSHGKMAVLKDDEVDRLERASHATSGPSRQDVMESMYGRLLPKPQEPSYSAEEVIAMRRREEEEKAAARPRALHTPSYLAIDIPKDMGLDCGSYRWRQNQSHVEVFIPLLPGLPTTKVAVTITPTRLAVELDERPILKGKLYKEVKAEESTWYVQDRVLEIVLLKRNRRGWYEKGTTNADTFWRSVVTSATENEVLALEYPPSCYYVSACESELPDGSTIGHRRPQGGGRQQIASSQQETRKALLPSTATATPALTREHRALQ